MSALIYGIITLTLWNRRFFILDGKSSFSFLWYLFMQLPAALKTVRVNCSFFMTVCIFPGQMIQISRYHFMDRLCMSSKKMTANWCSNEYLTVRFITDNYSSHPKQTIPITHTRESLLTNMNDTSPVAHCPIQKVITAAFMTLSALATRDAELLLRNLSVDMSVFSSRS